VQFSTGKTAPLTESFMERSGYLNSEILGEQSQLETAPDFGAGCSDSFVVPR
jgi:hypothetical protein